MNLLRKILLFLSVLSISFADTGPREWLIGHWKSNKELTIPTLRYTKELTPDQRARLENILGKYEICFGTKEATYHMSALRTRPAYSGAARYQIVSETKDRLIVRCVEVRTGKEDVSKIRFEGSDRYWVAIDTFDWMTGWQCFDRVNYPMPKEPNQPSEPTAASGRGSS